MPKKKSPQKQSASQPLIKFLMNHWFNLVVVLAGLVIALLYVWPVRFLPYHLDAARLVVNGAVVLSERGFNPLTLTELGISHPPLLMIYLASLWNIFGMSMVVSHLSMIPFLVLLLTSSFLLFRKFIKLEIAVLLTLVVATLPIVVSQYQQISIPLALASLMIASLVLWLNRKPYFALIVLGVASLVNGMGLLLLPAFIGDWWLQGRKQLKFRSLVIPFGFLVVWYLYHGSVTGWWIVSPYSGWSLPNNPLTIISYSFFTLRQILFSQFYALVSVPMVLGVGLLFLQKKLDCNTNRILALFSLSLITTAIYFGIAGQFSYQAVIFLLPLWLLTFAMILKTILDQLFSDQNNNMLVGVGLILVIFVALTQWRVDPASQTQAYFGTDQNMIYQDRIFLGQQLAGYLQIYHSNAQIFGGYPEDYQLTQTHQGYVTQPLNFAYCDQFEFNPSVEQLIIFHPYHQSQLICRQLLDQYETEAVEQIVRGKRWVEIFSVTATKSATPQQATNEAVGGF